MQELKQKFISNIMPNSNMFNNLQFRGRAAKFRGSHETHIVHGMSFPNRNIALCGKESSSDSKGWQNARVSGGIYNISCHECLNIKRTKKKKNG